MTAVDVEPDRISAAKETAKEFVGALPSDSYVGVISFSGDSYIEQSLTKDKNDLKYSIDDIEVSGVGGTDVFEAVSNSIKLLREEKRGAIVLLSDGQINIGNFDEAVDYAKYNDIVVHTFGIGTVTGGEAVYGLSKLDEDSLKALAYNTDGRYFNVKSQGEMKQSFEEIIQVTRRLGSINLSFYLIIVVIVLFIVKQFLLSINKIVW